MNITLANGENVTLKEFWDCDDDVYSCGSHIVVYDGEDVVLARFNGTLPDTEDEDYDEKEYAEKIEKEISWFNTNF